MKFMVLLAFMFVFCTNVFPSDKFELLAEIQVPSLMTSAQNMTLLSENILPGKSAIIGIAVAALAFDPKLAGFDLTAPIQILGFGSRTAGPKEIQWAIVMSPKNTNNTSMEIIDKKRTVYVKAIGDRSLLSYNKTLTDGVNEIPSAEEEND